MILGWSTKNLIIIGLIALAILAIILVVLFLVFGKKFKKKSGSPQAGTTTTTKAAVTKNISADPKYQPVPNV
jgi:flagellar basal body-associated protein FliL